MQTAIDVVPDGFEIGPDDFFFHHGNRPCPGCGALDWRWGPGIFPWECLANVDRPRLIECGSCGTSHAPALKSPKYTKRGSHTASPNEAVVHARKAEVSVSQIAEQLRARFRDRNACALVVGCETGFEISALLSADIGFAQVDGLDPSPAAAAIARQRHCGDPRVNIHEGLVSDIPEGKTYDFILAIMVWEHIPDPVEALQAARSHLADDGMLALQVPRYDNAFPKFIRTRLWYGVHYNHLWYFTKRGFLSFLQRNGYTVEHVHNVPRVATPAFIFWRLVEVFYVQVTRYLRIGILERIIQRRYATPQAGQLASQPVKRNGFVRVGFLRDAMTVLATKG